MRVINVSPHLLMDVVSCDTKAWTRHVKGFTSKGDAIKAVAGQAFHAAIATLWDPAALVQDEKRAPSAVAEFHRIYDPAYERLPAEKLEPSLTPHNLHRVLERWIQLKPPAALPWKRVVEVETAFVVCEWIGADDNERIRLIVRPDAIVEDHNGKYRWVDTKTTGWHIGDASWKLNLRLSLQTQLYSAAVVKRFGDAAIYGGWINAIELRKLPEDPTRKCAEHKKPYAECGNEHAKVEIMECLTTEARVERALRDAENAAMEFVRLLDADAVAATGGDLQQYLGMQGTANGTCRFCPANQWCDTSRPMREGALESFMLYEPYPVEEGKR